MNCNTTHYRANSSSVPGDPTARAGASGQAITFACERYVAGLEPIEAYIGMKIPVEWADDSLFVAERPAPPRQFDRHGGMRVDHGDGGHRGHRGHGRPDRTDRVVGHHVSKDAAIEAELEAKGRIRDEQADRPPAPPRGDRPPRPHGRDRHPRPGDRRPNPPRNAPSPMPRPEDSSEPVIDPARIDEFRFRDDDAPAGAPAGAPKPEGAGQGAKRRRRRGRGRGGEGGGPSGGARPSGAGDAEDDLNATVFFQPGSRGAAQQPVAEGGGSPAEATAEGAPGSPEGAARRRRRRRGGRGRSKGGSPAEGGADSGGTESGPPASSGEAD